jgi:DNA (cytosine-5)-methyltransferase 1
MPKKKNKPLRVVELFAGVGGFRLGLEGYNGKSPLSGYKKPMHGHFEVIWSNQWEPSTKRQHANEVYAQRWSESEKYHNAENIEDVIQDVPFHDVLVGGFPCQDYSVATTLKNSKGLIGVKGVLWWSIYSILKNQGKKKPKYLILENVDRLLVSPSNQRGRDFAVILACLNELGYFAEWRVINAAEYGMPQRRRRTFIIGFLKDSTIGSCLKKVKNKNEWLNLNGIFASEFKIDPLKSSKPLDPFPVKGDLKSISDNFNKGGKFSPFKNTGLMINGNVHTIHTNPIQIENGMKLVDVLIDEAQVKKEFQEFYIDPKNMIKKDVVRKQIDDEDITLKTELDMWKYYKGKKKEPRKNKAEGYTYNFAEGEMVFPDNINKPSRTIITGEGGSSPSRFKHVIKVGRKFRRLTPIELERLNMFPDNHTKHDDITNPRRAFFMGNALVVGVVEKIGKSLTRMIKDALKN